MGKNVAIDAVEKLVSNTEYSDPIEIGKNYNKYFSKIASSLDDSLPVNQKNSLRCVSYISDSLILYPIATIESITSNLKITKQHINKIVIQIYIENQSYHANIISDLMNFCYVDGQFPKSLKIASITPIHKLGDRERPQKYRPISILHFITKFIERSLHNRIYGFISKHSIKYNKAFGFLKNA